MDWALKTDGLTKSFADRDAVKDLSLRVPDKAIYGFLGANGAGKTTTMRLVLGLIRMTGGTIDIFGQRVGRDAMPRVGALIETPSLYPHLTGRENLDITGHLLGLAKSEIDRVLEIVELAYAARQRVASYSLGMRQRLAIARALLGHPRLLILDEPTNGLDPEGIVDMRRLIRRLPDADGATLIVSSHHLSEIEKVATHVGLIHHGRLLVQDEIKGLLRQGAMIELVTDDHAATRTLLASAGFTVAGDDEALLVDAPSPAEVAALVVGRGQQLHHLRLRQPSLEQAYHHAIAA